jgi:hypothetical protein
MIEKSSSAALDSLAVLFALSALICLAAEVFKSFWIKRTTFEKS